MVSLANAGQYQGARQELGRALHALQSFYSHTNWLEQFGSVINDKLGAQNDLGVSIASPATPTCRNCLKSELSATQLSQLNSFSAGLQEGSNTFWRPEFKADAVFSCSDNLIANSLLTTGYYSRDAIVSKPLNASKCSIGGGTDSSATSQATGGIGKGSASFLFSPHHELHSTAARVAHDASVAFLADVRKSVGDYNFGRLLGLAGQRVLGILMDTTGSMSSSITAAKAWAQQMVRNASASGDDTIYILTPFNDPAFGPYQQTTNAQQMLNWINPLSAGGGGDAPEKCFAALFLTLQQCPTQADLIVFTDAPTKDANLYPAIYALAVQKSARINFLVQGGHSLKMKLNNGTEVDREISKDSDIGNFDLYQALATATGGAYAVMGSGASEILNTTRIVDSAANMGVLVRQDKISGTAGGQWNFSVDGRLSSVEVVVSSVASLSTSRIHLIDPNGTESNHFLVSTATNVLLQANNPKQPDAGVSTSNVALLVRGASSISFTFSVTSPAENGRWPGLVPLSGKPIGGQTYFLTIDCDVCSTIESVQLRTCADNQLLATLPASQMEKAQIWFASALMPVTDAELCASFTGLDDLGLRYQRIARETVTPTQIKLEAQVINGTQSLFPMQTAV
uniref:VWFA domain-containing protein n=1 Tax=Plectus sambesii TaxID=2011161 RepID=A0A914X9W3_9BILA